MNFRLNVNHPHNKREDEDVRKFLKENGAKGYGVYWYVMEALYSNMGAVKYEDLIYTSALPDLRITEWGFKRLLEKMKPLGIKYENDIVFSDAIERIYLEENRKFHDRKRNARKAGFASAEKRKKLREEEDAKKEKTSEDIPQPDIL